VNPVEYPQLFAADGTPVQIPADQIPAAIASGKYAFQRGAMVPVVTPEGEPVTVSAEELPKALEQQFQIEPPDAVARRMLQQQYGEGIGNVARAFAEGAARGVSVGLSDPAMVALGADKEALAARKEFNPVAATTGEVAGIAAPLLLSGGSSAAAQAARLTPAAGVAALGEGVTGLVAKGIGSEAAQSLGSKIAIQSLARGAGSVVEGAAFGVGGGLSEAALGDPRSVGETVMHHAGLGAIIGGTLGPLAGALEGYLKATPKVVNQAKEAIQAAVAEAQKQPGIVSKIAARISGKSIEDVGPLLDLSAQGAAYRREAIESLASRESMVDDFAQALSKQSEAMNRLKREFNSVVRPEETAKHLSEIPVEAAFEKAVDLSGDLKKTVETIRGDQALYKQAYGSKLQKVLDSFEKALIKSESANDVFQAAQTAKREIDTFSKYGVAVSLEDKEALSLVGRIRRAFQEHLEDAEIYGQAGARQAAINEAYSTYLAAETNFNKAFGQQVAKVGGKETVISPGKVATFLRNINKPEQELRAEALSQYMEAAAKFEGVVSDSAASSLNRNSMRALRDLHDRVTDVVQGAEVGSEAANRLNRLKKPFASSNIIETGVAAGAASMLGAPVAPVALGVQAYRYLNNPHDLVMMLHKLDTLNSTIRRQIENGTRAIVNAASSFQSGAMTPIAVGAITRTRLDSDKSDRSQGPRYRFFQKRLDEIAQAVSDPERLVDNISNATSSISKFAPKTAEALAERAMIAAQFLYSKAPKDPLAGKTLLPHQSKWRPSDAEISTWERYVHTVDNPLSVLKDIRSGFITKEQVETLQTVYPEMYKQMTVALVDALANARKAPPYRVLQGLQTFFGAPVDPTQYPEFVMAMQANAAQPLPQDGGRPGGQAHGSPNAIRLADRAQTETESVMNRGNA
jgi:hypothetical protein